MAWRNKMKRKKAPPGWELVEPVLEDYRAKMDEAMNEPIDDKMRNELNWKVHRISNEKTRAVYNMYHKEHLISKKLLDYLGDEKLIDGKLMAKWKRPGYERLCSVATISKANTNFGTTSICRVPLRDRHGQIMPNIMTGCVSCASEDKGPIWWDQPIPTAVRAKLDTSVPPEGPDLTEPTPQSAPPDPNEDGAVSPLNHPPPAGEAKSS